MWPIAFPQAKGAPEIALQHWLLLDIRQQSLVDLLLVLCPILADLLLLRLALVEESFLTALLVRLLVSREVPFASDLVNGAVVDAVQIHRSFGSDHVAGVDTPKWNTVDFEGSRHEHHTLVEYFEEDYTLASETAGEEDENFARCEGFAGFVWTLRFAGLPSEDQCWCTCFGY